MKYSLITTSRFKKSLKLAKKRGLNISLLKYVIDMLQDGQQLPKEYRDHSLSGSYQDFRECHIQPDWLLLYLVKNDVLTLTLIDTGTHSDIFKL